MVLLTFQIWSCYLVHGLELLVLPDSRDPTVLPQLQHILQHGPNSGRNFAFLDDVSDSLEISIHTTLWHNNPSHITHQPKFTTKQIYLTLACFLSKSLPVVVMSLEKHSKLSSSDVDFRRREIHSCMIVSDNICSLKSSPMKQMFPNDLFLFLVIANSSSSFRAACSAS